MSNNGGGRRKDDGWNETYLNDEGKFFCLYCNEHAGSKISRVRTHMEKCKLRKVAENKPDLEVFMEGEEDLSVPMGCESAENRCESAESTASSSLENRSTSPMSQSSLSSDNSSDAVKKAKKPKKVYSCRFCGKTFRAKTFWTRHERVHTGEKPFKCEICGKCFSQRSILITHKKMHAVQKIEPYEPFQCDICNKSYRFLKGLTKHKRKHTEENPNKCDLCNKLFHSRAYIAEHKEKVHGERPSIIEKLLNRNDLTKFSLPIKNENKVDKIYKKDPLKKVNDPGTPYQCDICHKSFTGKLILTVHKRTHTDTKQNQYDVCQNVFAQGINLNTHTKDFSNCDNFVECGITIKKEIDEVETFDEDPLKIQIKEEINIEIKHEIEDKNNSLPNFNSEYVFSDNIDIVEHKIEIKDE